MSGNKTSLCGSDQFLRFVADAILRINPTLEISPHLLIEEYLADELAQMLVNRHSCEKSKAILRWQAPQQVRQKVEAMIPAPGSGMIQWRDHLPTCCGTRNHKPCTCGAFR